MMARMAEAAVAARTSRDRRLGIVAVSIATVVWATGTIIVKDSTLSGLRFAMFRLWAGVAVSLVALLVTRRRLRWSTFRACALGGVFFAGDIALHFTSVKLTSVADVALIGALAPVVIAIASAKLLGERIPRRDAVLVGVSFAGVVIVAVGSAGSPTWSLAGDLLAVLGIGTWVAYWFFSRRARHDVPSIEYFACVMIAGALVMTPTAIALEGVPPLPTAAEWVSVVAVAILPGFVGHTLVIWSHPRVESWLSALITQCTPIVAVILAWVVLGEEITPAVALGGTVVIVATAAVILEQARRQMRIHADVELDEATERAN
jgi:drug/metabolite transporter (DMT)-like permease